MDTKARKGTKDTGLSLDATNRISNLTLCPSLSFALLCVGVHTRFSFHRPRRKMTALTTARVENATITAQ